jgi:hypothetical protein
MHDPSEHTADVLGLDTRDYRRRISVGLDFELIECLDARRAGASRSDYVERVLFAHMAAAGAPARRLAQRPRRPARCPRRSL